MIRRSAPSKVKVQDNNGGMQVFDAFSRAEVAVPFRHPTDNRQEINHHKYRRRSFNSVG